MNLGTAVTHIRSSTSATRIESIAGTCMLTWLRAKTQIRNEKKDSLLLAQGSTK